MRDWEGTMGRTIRQPMIMSQVMWRLSPPQPSRGTQPTWLYLRVGPVYPCWLGICLLPSCCCWEGPESLRKNGCWGLVVGVGEGDGLQVSWPPLFHVSHPSLSSGNSSPHCPLSAEASGQCLQTKILCPGVFVFNKTNQKVPLSLTVFYGPECGLSWWILLGNLRRWCWIK